MINDMTRASRRPGDQRPDRKPASPWHTGRIGAQIRQFGAVLTTAAAGKGPRAHRRIRHGTISALSYVP